MTQILRGKLLTYSEQGMEGGYLSIQENDYISFTAPTFGVFDGQNVCHKDHRTRFGITSNTEVLIDDVWCTFPDPIRAEADYKISTLYCGEERGNLEADKRLAHKFGFSIKYSAERLNEKYGAGNWSIDGKLPKVLLKNGTRLYFDSTPRTQPKRPYGASKGTISRNTVTWNDGIIEQRVISDVLLVQTFDQKGLHMLKSNDFLKVIDPHTQQIICERRIADIPLDVFSPTLKGHFAHAGKEADTNWEVFFTNYYEAEVHRE